MRGIRQWFFDVMRRLHASLVHHRRVANLGRVLAAAIPRDVRTLLDVGSGDGLLARSVTTHRPDLAITGVDIVPRRETFMEVALYDGTRLPFANNAFDAVMLVDVLHHAADIHVLLCESARVARQVVVVKDHLNERRIDGALLRAMDWLGNRHNDVPLRYRYCSRRQWLTEIPRAGMELETFDDRVGVYPWPLSAVIGRRLHVIWTARPAGSAFDRSGRSAVAESVQAATVPLRWPS
ncbi:MAG: class I SAM-dependent methyltransferase [Ilumatobacteraceae bacterium]